MEHIIAAIPNTEPSKNVSSEEFQGMLTSWFEEKGILSELRTSLRYKMINILKNTAIGRDISRKTSSSVSLSKQAINLIVAEYLMKNNCDYSLSLFNTEVGLSNTFSDSIITEGNKSNLQFNKENILHILELIGVNKTSDLCCEILDMYYKDSDTTLLSSIISVLKKCLPTSTDLKHSDIDLTHEVDFIRNVGSILIRLNMPHPNIVPAIESIKSVYNAEIQKIDDDYNKLMSKLKNHSMSKEKQALEQTKDVEKKNEILGLTVAQLTQNHNELQIQIKQLLKENAAKEKELIKIKRSLKQSRVEVESTSKKSDRNIECTKDHCGNGCRKNSEIILKLQSENEELVKKNTDYLQEISDWKIKYQGLLSDFTSFHQKISSLNFKTNNGVPMSLLNMNLLNDVTSLNENIPFESVDSPESSTEEVIRHARKQLKLLEEESQEIEDKYKKAHAKNKCKVL